MMNDENQKRLPVYIGTYTNHRSEGIYRCDLDTVTGELSNKRLACHTDNPSYLAIDAERNRLYAVNEFSESGERPGGRISAFAIKPPFGELTLINQQDSRGGAPCYLTLERTGRFLFAVNYSGGNIVVIPIGEDGAVEEPTDVVAHSGSSLHPERQESPHPHSIILAAANNNVFVPDLGLDKVMQYRFKWQNGRLVPNAQPWIAVQPGSGPRHILLHPNNRRAYVINELSSTITVYAYDPILGTLTADQTISTVPEGYSGRNIAADIHLTPNGSYLFGSNRGHNSIVSYAVDEATGRLRYSDLTPSLGQKPRGFAIDPSGTFLLAANQDSHNIVTFRIDYDRGAIVPTGHTLQIPSPVCLKFLSVKAS